MSDTPIHDGFAELGAAYDAFIVDLWGVLHDGMQAYPHARDCLAQLKSQGKRVLILSNAPRRADEVTARNRELGLDDSLYDRVMSSGEATWQALQRRSAPWYAALGRRCYHLGPTRDLSVREGLDYDFVEQVSDADFLLNTGALEAEDRVEDYAELLGAAHARSLPMVCANPDLVVMRGDDWEICAGAIAQAYEEMGGEVQAHGKPHKEIYRTCFETPGFERPERILAVGDSLRTDVAGARAAGIDVAFIARGIHAGDVIVDEGTRIDPMRLGRLCVQAGVQPTAALLDFRW